MRLMRALGLAAFTPWLVAGAAQAADASAGATRFATPPRPGLLACIDCHSDNPQLNNFGNIWSGRNAVALIQRAVDTNNGGMGYFNSFYSAADFANIAAYLGNTPANLSFPLTALGGTSAAQSVTLSSSTKTGFDALGVAVEGDFVLLANGCGTSVPRFSSCRVDVGFRPTAAGQRGGALLLTHDGTPTPIRIQLDGEGSSRPKAVATLTPAALDFGSQALGTDAPTRLLVLANNSEETLTLGAISSSTPSFVVAGGSCSSGAGLRRGQRCVLGLRFVPGAPGEHRGQLHIAHDGADGASTTTLSGTGLAAAAQLGADIDALDFGQVSANTRSAPRVLNIVNLGQAPLTLREAGVSDAAFTLDAGGCAGGTTLAPQQRCTMAVSFAPGRNAVFSGALRVVAGDGAALRLPLFGLASAALATPVPQRLAMSEVLGHSSSATLALVNQGPSAWQLRAISLSGPEAADFAIDGGSCVVGRSVAPGTSCSVELRFTPRATGARTARLQLAHDAAATPAQVALFGEGLAVPNAALWVDAAALDFAARPVGAAALPARMLTVWPGGRAALTWERFTLVGEHAGDFSLGGDCQLNPALSSPCRVELAFTPRGSGQRSATLVLWPKDAAAPALVSLQGRGLTTSAAAWVADRLTLDFGKQAIGVAGASRRLRFTNAGSASAVLPALRLQGPFNVMRQDAACAAALAPGQGCAVDIGLAAASVGIASGVLTLEVPAQPALRVALMAQPVERAALLAWGATAPAAGAFPATAVGESSLAASVSLINLGNAAAAPLSWAFSGDGAGDFSVDAGSGCSFGLVLAPGASCNLKLRLQPTQAGTRAARLVAAGEAAVDELPLQGQALGPALADLRATPALLAFAARTGQIAEPQALWLRNVGAASLHVETLAIQGSGFTFSGGENCAARGFELLPGMACVVDVSWNGAAAAANGGSLAASGDGPLVQASASLSVTEDPAQQNNAGTGGGALGLPALCLLLLCVCGLLRTESRHG